MSTSEDEVIETLDLGITEYGEALHHQKEILCKRLEGRTRDTLLLTEHYPVITLGRLASEEDVILPEVYEEVPLIRTNRGGDITVHSPGQLLIYPVIDISRSLRSLSGYIDLLEEFAVRALNEEGVKAQRTSRRGVWVGGKKIAFIGVSAKRWVTYHGIAVNINNDLNLFNGINPCGENDIKVTSVYEETGKEADIPSMKKLFIEKFKETFSEWTEKTR